MLRLGPVAIVGLVACSRAERDPPRPPPPPPPTVLLRPPIDAPPPIDAATPVDAAPIDAPIDAPAMPRHTHLRVRDFSEEAYYGLGAVESPGLPAYDTTTATIAVAYDEQAGLGTEPNVELQLLDPADASVRTKLPVWTQAQSRAIAGHAPGPARLVDLERAIDVELVKVERKIRGFAPMAACTPDEELPQADVEGLPYCPGKAAWRCDDATITYRRDRQGNPRTTLKITVKGTPATTVDTTSWRKPAVQMYSGSKPIDMKVDTVNCIAAAHRIPDSRSVLLELAHTCNTSGDWCWVGGPTWQVVSLP